MPDIQQSLGRALLKSMVEKREQKGEISLEDVGAIFMELASSVNPATGVADNFVHKEIAR